MKTPLEKLSDYTLAELLKQLIKQEGKRNEENGNGSGTD